MKRNYILTILCVFFVATAAFAESKFLPAETNPIPDQYIVVLKEGVARYYKASASEGPSVSQIANELIATYGGKVNKILDYSLQAFVAQMSEKVAKAMSEDSRVSKVRLSSF